MTPGRNPSMRASAPDTRSRTTSTPSGRFKSTDTDRLRRRDEHERQLARPVGELEGVDAEPGGVDGAAALPHGKHGLRSASRALLVRLDDDVAEALYSADRSVRTYSRSQVTPLRNNYNGATPDPSYIPDWTLSVSGLASERTERLAIGDLLSRFQRREQVTRICCVEGWSAVA